MNIAAQGMGAQIGGCRQKAKSVLEDKIARMRREADKLEALMNALPELEGDADQAMWDLLWASNR